MSKQKQKHRKGYKRTPAIPPQPAKASFAQNDKRAGLLVTSELAKALQDCKSRVDQIAEECKQRNRKFRDLEFDLEYDRARCLNGLYPKSGLKPSDVQRVSQIFKHPEFMVNGASSNDLIQSAHLGDCWFVSALATMSTYKGFVEKFFVEQNAEVGVYGFIFFRDNSWVVVIVDDLLFTSIPKFEELTDDEKSLYHHDKEAFNRWSRKSGKSLYFARSGEDGETWVPLIEKAYAKLHGNYAALDGGQAGEAIEDLTGGVSSFILTKDILNIDRFWEDELLKASENRLFGCSFGALDNTRSGNVDAKVNGLMGGHAYSVLRAVECNGERFVIVRNPWGNSEWTGPWSDGSSEWTPEWLSVLPQLDHSFGNDGQFVMEYKDFLENWAQIDRTLVFDQSWIMSSHWLRVTTRGPDSAWTYGDVSFTISLPEASDAVIVLSQLEKRYFKPISGLPSWSFDFVVFRKGNSKPIAISSPSILGSRSVNTEVPLKAGEYVVHVRLDRDTEPFDSDLPVRTFGRVFTERAKSQSIASNFDRSAEADSLPIPIETLAGQDLAELEAKAAAAAETLKKEKEALQQKQMEETSATDANTNEKSDDENEGATLEKEATVSTRHDNLKCSPLVEQSDSEDEQEDADGSSSKAGEDEEQSEEMAFEDNVVYLGLRVYTQKDSPAKIDGQLRHETGTNFNGLASGGL